MKKKPTTARVTLLNSWNHSERLTTVKKAPGFSEKWIFESIPIVVKFRRIHSNARCKRYFRSEDPQRWALTSEFWRREYDEMTSRNPETQEQFQPVEKARSIFGIPTL